MHPALSVIFFTVVSGCGFGALFLVAAREGYDLMPEMGYKPVNKYLPPRPRRDGCASSATPPKEAPADFSTASPLLRWIDKILTR